MARALLCPGTMNLRQITAAGLGGAIATAVDVTTLVLQVRHGTPIALAAFVAAAAGAVVCFAFNKYLAFRDRDPVTIQQLARFGVVAAVTALGMALAMQLIAVEFGVPYLSAKLICSVLVFLTWTYPAQRRLVFRASLSPSLSASMSLSRVRSMS
jgi:putative flippase GtrA